jgi:hypothetical protein
MAVQAVQAAGALAAEAIRREQTALPTLEVAVAAAAMTTVQRLALAELAALALLFYPYQL